MSYREVNYSVVILLSGVGHSVPYRQIDSNRAIGLFNMSTLFCKSHTAMGIATFDHAPNMPEKRN
jgi:hypothetical protein